MSDERALVPSPIPQDVRIELLRERLVHARQRTRDSLVGLRSEVSERIEWRGWVRARPVPFLVVAFLAGLFLGTRR